MADRFNTITLNLENGETIAAPLGIWLAALLSTLPADQQNKIKETVANMVKEAQQRSSIIQPKNYRMQADPLNLGIKMGGKNGNS